MIAFELTSPQTPILTAQCRKGFNLSRLPDCLVDPRLPCRLPLDLPTRRLGPL